jgi:hypothetical protein
MPYIFDLQSVQMQLNHYTIREMSFNYDLLANAITVMLFCLEKRHSSITLTVIYVIRQGFKTF